MIENRKRQSNFVCNPDLPWGPIYDSTLFEDGNVTNYRFVDEHTDLVPQDNEIHKTRQHLKEIFSQFKDIKN